MRVYELDSNGHVNNAVFLNYAEQLATSHTDAVGWTPQRIAALGGTWVVRRHEITYHRPAQYGEELRGETRVGEFRGARGYRHTRILRDADNTLLVELTTEWVWIRLSDGRPTRVPNEVTASFRQD